MKIKKHTYHKIGKVQFLASACLVIAKFSGVDLSWFEATSPLWALGLLFFAARTFGILTIVEDFSDDWLYGVMKDSIADAVAKTKSAKTILFLAACLTLSVTSAQTASYTADSSGVQIEVGPIFQVRDSLGNIKYVSLAELHKTLQTPSKKQDETLLKVTLFTFLGLLAGVLLTR